MHKEMKKETLNKRIKAVTEEYKAETLALVERVFTEYMDAEEGKAVRKVVEEIRSKKYYVPELELMALDEEKNVIGYVMFSRFHLNGNYEDKLLILTPAAVETRLQRRHISKDIIEYGFEKAKEMGFEAVLVEGDPANYHARGFERAATHGILAGETVHLPHIDCLMVKELIPGTLQNIRGTVEYDFYESFME